MNIKVPVSERALMQRANRVLKVKSWKAIKAQGRYYLIDAKRGTAVRCYRKLEKLALALGVISTWEKV